MQEDKKILTRFATRQDVSALIALWQQFMRDEREAVPDANPGIALDNWNERLRAQIANSQVVVVEINHTLVGFAGFIGSAAQDWIPQSVAYVVDMYVVPEARRSSAARLLFEHLLRHAALGYTEVWTNTSIRNRRVQTLLTRAGFAPLDGFNIPGLDDQLYFKRLAD